MTGLIEIGSLVEVRGQQWLLVRAQPFKSCTVLSLEGRDRANAMERLQLIAPFDRPRSVASTTLQRRRRKVVLSHALAAIHSATPVDGLWTAASARIDLLAYQLEPALAAIDGATRLLLADAVGLGKTIQAGLLLSELLQRGWIARALIVCPAGMRETWCRELQQRFGIGAVILDQQSIADRVASFPPGINPWSVDSVTIVSIDFLKRREVMAAVDGVPVDLLIADEAHHLSSGTDRGAAVARLAARSTWCVLVSATPHSGDREAFANLTGLGHHAEEIRIFRRRRTDVGLPHARRTHFLKIHVDAGERTLLEAIARYSQAIWIGRGRTDHAARFVALTLARRACSSLAAIDRTLRRRRDLLGSMPGEASHPRLPWEDVDDADGDEGDDVVAVQGFDNLDEERRALDDLIALVPACASSSKLRRLQRLLSCIGEPAIVFTEYRDTLESIVRSLGPSYRVASIHGAMSRDDRTATVDHFNAGGVDILVATDAAGEGLNLHHRCRLVIDVELPWNPLRLEQRAGRVDRIGQRRIVHAIRLFHGGTIEEAVLDRLELRRHRAEQDLERAVSERDVAAAVFAGEEMVPISPRAERSGISARAIAERGRLEGQRLQQGRTSITRCWAAPKHPGVRRLACVVRETDVNAHGTVIGTRVHAVELMLDRRPRTLKEWRSAIDAIATRCSTPREPDVAGRGAILRRIDAIRVMLARDQRREYQRSLFDGRAEAAMSAREHDAARLAASLERIERALAPADPSRTRIDVMAAWPERRA